MEFAREDFESMSDLQLTKKVMNLEFKLQDAMRREKHYNRGSTTYTLHTLCNDIWRLLERRQRHLAAFGTPLPRKTPKAVPVAPKAVKRVFVPYG